MQLIAIYHNKMEGVEYGYLVTVAMHAAILYHYTLKITSKHLLYRLSTTVPFVLALTGTPPISVNFVPAQWGISLLS